MQIFGGSSNQNLVQRIAKNLGWKVGQVEITRFANDEVRVLVTEPKIDNEIYVLQSLSDPTDHHVIEFLMLVDALRRKGAKDISVIIPYMGYSKQDKVFREGESLSVKVIAQMLQIMPLSKIITFDLHNLAILGFYDIPVKNISAFPLFIEHFSKLKLDNYIVVAPDAGAAKKSSSFAGELGLDIVYIDKKRDLSSGEVIIKGISGEVQDKDVLITDDMVATGSTLVESSKFLHENGAKSVTIAVTHFLNVKGVAKKLMSSDIDHIITTNTISFEIPSSKFTILDVSPLITQTLS